MIRTYHATWGNRKLTSGEVIPSMIIPLMQYPELPKLEQSDFDLGIRSFTTKIQKKSLDYKGYIPIDRPVPTDEYLEYIKLSSESLTEYIDQSEDYYCLNDEGGLIKCFSDTY